MSDRPTARDFLYVHTEIPPGMTIAQWRAQRATRRPDPRRRTLLGRIGRLVARIGGLRHREQTGSEAGVGVRVVTGRVRKPSAARSWTRQALPCGSLRES